MFPLSSVRSTHTWGYQTQHLDTLYYGPQPFLFYMPGSVTYISLAHQGGDLYRLDLEILPLALEDVIGLDILASFGSPVSRM